MLFVKLLGKQIHIVLFLFTCILCSSNCDGIKTHGQNSSTAGDIVEFKFPDGDGEEPGAGSPPPPIPESIQAIFDATIADTPFSFDEHFYYWRTKHGLQEFDIEEALFDAVATNDIRLVKEIMYHYSEYKDLWAGADIRLAVGGGLEMVKMLLDAGFVCNERFAKGWLGGARTWWERGWNGWSGAFYTPLSEFAYRCDDPAVIQLLIDRGAQVNTTSAGMGDDNRSYSAVFRAAEAGKAGNLRVLINAGGNVHLPGFWYNETPLIAAAKSGSDECVELLLQAGADASSSEDFAGTTALLEAAASGNERSVRLLLESGALHTINAQRKDGSTALMEAAITGNAQSLQMLIDKGADPATKSGGYFGFEGWELAGGQTALMMASTPECVEILLKAGAAVNDWDDAGRNALLFQCFFYRRSKSVSLLIEAGSYLYDDRDGGKTLPRIASDSGSGYEINDEIIAMLLKAGCQAADSEESAYSFRRAPGDH